MSQAAGVRRLELAGVLRTGGWSGCQLAGTCRVCRPLAKQFQEAKAPLGFYCQHGRYQQEVSMTAVALTLYPTCPAGEPEPEVIDPVMVDLDQVIESTTRSCNAGDDNPH
jgi:hypothetical protein